MFNVSSDKTSDTGYEIVYFTVPPIFTVVITKFILLVKSPRNTKNMKLKIV